MRRRASLLLLVVVLASVVPPVTAAPIAHREVMANGLVLLVAERPAVPIVAVRLFTAAGAIFDPTDRGGLAHLTGAVLTRGTAKHSGPAIDTAIESVGGSLEADTGREGLTASVAVLKRDLSLGLDLLSEVVLTPAFPDAEVIRKRAQIQAAIRRSEEDPGTVATRALARLVFPNHPYGRPVEGTVDSVAKLTRDDVVAFYRQHARPDTSIVAVVGAVTLDEARREVAARFAGWVPPAVPAPDVAPAMPGGAPRAESITKDLTQATIALGRQGIRQMDPDYFPLAVASYILGGGSTSRLYGRVRDEGGLAYAVFSSLAPSKHGSSLAVSAQTRTGEVSKVIDIMRAEMARLGAETVSDAELKLAKDYLRGSFPLRLDTSAKVADFLVAIEVQGLGLDYAERYRERIAAVTADQVRTASAKYFAPDTFNRVVVGAPAR